ncbi:Gar1/Naf1 RNA binding region-domain-containing protein [Amylostereum chailletii]|nr:Gar1/Naf1 RNA binding region-domain-containing protein [Amylostereum chailletii]
MDPSFKVPSILPQDLLFIQDIVGHIPQPPSSASHTDSALVHDDYSVASSGDEANSEDEVEAGILIDEDDSAPGTHKEPSEPSDTASDVSSISSSDSDDNDNVLTRKAAKRQHEDEDEDEEDGEGGPSTTAVIRTKNELPEGDFKIPEIVEVGPNESLEKVGQVMSLLHNMVIVKGEAGESMHRASEKALDSDTLLVFGDRKVLGYVYETFGPTYQPMYQIKFGEKYPLHTENIQVGRDVFHVPAWSNFVFLNEIKRFKGSDASNVHDEEPAEYELEFSDDDEEAAHKARLKQRRQGSREPSSFSARSTPAPSSYQDQGISADVLYGSNPYDAHGPYDVDFAAGPSRPPPVPYDDPYSNDYNVNIGSAGQVEPLGTPSVSVERTPSRYPGEYDRGRARGGGRRLDRGGGGSRGARGTSGRGGRRGRGGERHGWTSGPRSQKLEGGASFSRAMSPTSMAIARATGQYDDGHGPGASEQHSGNVGSWTYDQYQGQPSGHLPYAPQPHQFVQPHINPRFASQFGLGMGFMQQNLPQYGQPGWYSNWDGSAHSNGQSGQSQNGDNQNGHGG